jgi:glycosyltransferase involved in cell wall biosynthesis
MIKNNNEESNISCLLPVKNGEQFLYTLIPTIQNNMRKNDELFIVNDGSTDNSKNILDEFTKSDSRISVITTNGIGLVNALNLGLNSVKYEWVARFDVDDEYSRNRLEVQRKLINPETVGIFSDYQFISKIGIDLGTMYSAIFPACTAISLLSSQRTAHPSAIINRLAVQSVGGYLLEDFPAEDLSLWLRLSHVGDLVTSPSTLLKYRIHPSSISQKNSKLILEKKNKLINEIRLPNKPILDFTRDFEKYLEDYSNYPNNNFRKSLIIRDLFILDKHYGNKINLSKYLAIIENFTKYTNLHSVFTLHSERKLKKKYRNDK